MPTHTMLNVDPTSVEYGTPNDIIETARLVMGSIDLDPASSHLWNENVKSISFFSEFNDGLSKSWYGNVWLNHPFQRSEKKCKPECAKKICEKRGYHTNEDLPGNKEWIEKLVSEYEKGNINQACCITYFSSSESWIKPLLNYPVCIPFKRTNYLNHKFKRVKGVQKGSSIFYLGNNVESFCTHFSRLGSIYLPLFYLGISTAYNLDSFKE